VAQAKECLVCELKALSSNPSPTKKKNQFLWNLTRCLVFYLATLLEVHGPTSWTQENEAGMWKEGEKRVNNMGGRKRRRDGGGEGRERERPQVPSDSLSPTVQWLLGHLHPCIFCGLFYRHQ
jgi:hypothetical protein